VLHPKEFLHEYSTDPGWYPDGTDGSYLPSPCLLAPLPQKAPPPLTVSAKTLTKIHCKAQGATKSKTRDAVLGKKVVQALKVSSSTSDSRVEVTAGYWTRDTPKKLTCLAFVSNLAAVRLTKKASVSAHSSSDSAKPIPHGIQFDFATTKTLTGTLTLTISGACTKGATDQYEILVQGDGWTKRFSSSSEKRFRKLVFKKVTINAKGLQVKIKSLAVALLSDKGHSRAQGRASVRFDVIKK
jgi:hypothetical protein